MKKVQFIKEIATVAGVSIQTASIILDTQIEVITQELIQGGEVTITGFGTFKKSARAARNGVNPRTREQIKIPAMNSPTFKAGKTFKEEIR